MTSGSGAISTVTAMQTGTNYVMTSGSGAISTVTAMQTGTNYVMTSGSGALSTVTAMQTGVQGTHCGRVSNIRLKHYGYNPRALLVILR